MKATCIEARNNKIERIIFFNLDQFDIHLKEDQTDNNMIYDKCIYTEPQKKRRMDFIFKIATSYEEKITNFKLI